jgi:hypothetical protein
VVQDQNGNQYLMGDAHVLAVGPYGILPSFSNTPITQPDIITAVRDMTSVPYSQVCFDLAEFTPSYTVANLGIVLPPDFEKGTAVGAEVALAPVVAGKVSPDILGIGTYGSTPFVVIKKGVHAQKTGYASGWTCGVVTKEKHMATVTGCQSQPNALDPPTCPVPGKAEVMNLFEVTVGCPKSDIPAGDTWNGKTGDFAVPGDSGSLVLTPRELSTTGRIT